jgi:uncharacterized protein
MPLPPDGPAADLEPEPGGRLPVPWGTTDVLGVLALTALLTAAVAGGAAYVLGADDAPRGVRGLLLPLPLVLLGVLTIAWVRVRHRAAAKLFGPAPAAAGTLVRAVGWGVGAFFALNVGIGLLVQAAARITGFELPVPQERMREMVADPVLGAWFLLVAVVVAPIAEELFFRGLVFQALRNRLAAGWSIAVASLIFAAAHVVAEPSGGAGLLIFVLIAPMGAVLAWLFERSGTLAVPIVVHATFNLLTTLALLAGAAVRPA